MARAPEDLVVRLLQEMRRDILDLRSEMDRRFDAVDRRFASVDDRLDDLAARFEGLSHITVLVASRQSQHDSRLDALEGR